jgi:iron complex outermembrane receptor protein
MPTLGAFAQDDEDSPIDRIVVTARKREESLQDTPLSVTALTSEAIEGLGIDNIDDVGALAPNLYMTQTPGSAANIGVSIRGVGGAEPLLTRDTGIAIYVDDAYVARTAGAAFDLVDLERVEILRGPQGTLYGRNATGGAIKFISRKPSEEFGIKQVFTLGTLSQFHSRTTVDTGLIGDTGLSATLTYLHKERDGYVDNQFASDKNDPGAYDTQGVRAALRWEVTEDLTVSYAYDYVDLDGAPPVFQLFGLNSTLTSDLGAAAGGLQRSSDRLENVSLDADDRSIWEISGHNLTLEYEIGEITLKSITTYRDLENSERGTDLDSNGGITLGAGLIPPAFAFGLGPFTGLNLFAATNEREQDQFSQEFQVLGNITDDIDFVAGVYYFEEEFEEDNLQEFLAPTGFGLVGIFDNSIGTGVRFAYDGEAESIAVFGAVNWAINEDWSTSVGLRWTKDEKEFVLTSASPFISGDDDWSNIDWHFDVGYAVNDEVNVYFRAASGFKSGGFNPRAGAAAGRAFDEETLINYEFGTKALLFDGRLQFNAAVFYSDYEDLQTDQFQAGSGGASSITVNAGQAEIFGIELELVAAPTDELTIYVNYGYQDLEYDEYEINDPLANGGAGGLVDIADDAIFAYRPKNTFSAGIEYAVPVGEMEFAIRLDSRFLDDLTWHATPAMTPNGFPLTPFSAGAPGVESIQEDGYFLVDLRATLSDIQISEKLSAKVAVFGRNIFDEEYIVSGIDFGGLGFGGARWGEPSTWGIDITFEY